MSGCRFFNSFKTTVSYSFTPSEGIFATVIRILFLKSETLILLLWINFVILMIKRSKNHQSKTYQYGKRKMDEENGLCGQNFNSTSSEEYDTLSVTCSSLHWTSDTSCWLQMELLWHMWSLWKVETQRETALNIKPCQKLKTFKYGKLPMDLIEPARQYILNMHAKDLILFRSLRLMITKAYVKFQLIRISNFREKVEQTNRQLTNDDNEAK